MLSRVLAIEPAKAGRPSRYDAIELAFLSAVFLIAFLTAPTDASGTANGPLMGFLQDNTGGGVCIFKRVVGASCPGCGLSRGFVQIAHGHPVDAVFLNPMTPLVFGALSLRFLGTVALVVLRRDVRLRTPLWLSRALWAFAGLGFMTIGAFRLVTHFWPR